MKKILLIFGASVLGIAIIIVAIGIYRFNFTNDDIYLSTGEKIDSKDATYIVNGQPVTLNDGFYESAATSNSEAKVITRYFGNDASGDLNNDGQADSAFLLTQETGGSGTFYYVAATLKNEAGGTGLNAVLLGDRIAPQTTEIKDGKIIVNYAERKADEPMSVQPSIGVSKYLQVVDNQLIEIKTPISVVNQEWRWLETKMNNDEIITPKKSEAFSLNLKGDGSLSGTTDCNGFFGNYTIVGNKLTFSQLGSTLMFCENSQESIFMKSLGEVESYFLDQNNFLVLQLKMDSGSMIFKLPNSPISSATTTSPINDQGALVGLANPASVNCSKVGGRLVMEKREDGGEYGLCYFEDNRACEEWALMRGECPTGGVKTTGFDTIDQKYCAWSGGETFAVPNSVCTFKNGKKCPTIDFYNGTCSSTPL